MEDDGQQGSRLARGRVGKGARFTAAGSALELPVNYLSTFEEIRRRLEESRLGTLLAANASMILSYWEVGRVILSRQEAEGWGARVIDRLSQDLSKAIPSLQGLSPRNLKYMRSFAAAWPDRETVQGIFARLPWRQNIALLEKLQDSETRIWYAKQALQHGWSQPILRMQIDTALHKRQGRALNNFPFTLPPVDSDLASQIFKDPYLFDFLGTADLRRERELEQALMDHIQRFLLELGSGFAFVGRQVHLEIGDQDFYLDLLFYHLKLRRFVVVELKAVPFEPGFTGQMSLYLGAVDDLLRHQDDAPSIGLLLCKGKNGLVVEYALRGMASPIGVADWQTQLTDSLPREFEGSLPTIAEIEAELANDLGDGSDS